MKTPSKKHQLFSPYFMTILEEVIALSFILSVFSSTTSTPTFVFPTSRHTFERQTGAKLTLICNVTDSLEVWWEHRTSSRVMIVAASSILYLENISLSDQGSYVCVAKGFRGDIAESEAQTLIIPVFSSTTSRPTFVFPTTHRTYEVLTGGKLTLICNVTDSVEVWWEHRTWSRVMIVAARSTLHLDNISLSDQGSYFCVAKGFRGQIAESEAQTLIIPGFAQVLLTTFLNYPDQRIAKNFRRAKFGVASITNETNAVLTLHLGKWLNSEDNYNDILGEIRDVVREFTRNLSHIHHTDFWIQGLSFCIEESDDTPVGTLTFPSTTINSTVDSHQLCIAVPDVHRGSRKCYGDLVRPATWKDSVVHNCFKGSATDADDNSQVLVQQFFKEVEESQVTPSNASFISRDLADITSSHNIRKEDIDHVATILERVTKVKSSSATVTNNVLETIDNIVSTSVTAQEILLTSETSSSLIKSLQHQLENVKMSGSNFSANRANFAVEVVQIENIKSSLTFASMESEDYNISETKLSQDPPFLDQEKIQASIHIPQPILQISSNCSSPKKSAKVSLPVTFTLHRSGALFNDPQAKKNNLIQNTWVVSASINCEISNLPLTSHISAWFSPTLQQKFQGKAKCVFWDHDLSGNTNGGWSSEGCLDPMTKDPDIYKCSCSHMPKFASFAVLMDLKGNINSKALHILTVIGCVTSIVGLIVTIISYLSISKFRSSQPKQIVLNLCAALLGLYCCFLIGINRTKNQIVCVIFGGLIHFFCLSTVAWMSVEATQLYILLVKVINAPVKHFLIKCSLVAWGLPFAVVAVCVAVANEDYSNEVCFPGNTTNVFYIGVLGLVAVMLAYNSVIYIVIVWNLSVTSKHKAKGQTNKDRIVPRLKNAFAISVLLGLTWLFGFLAIGSMRMTFNILFCLFNSLQGFIIFLLFCTRQEEVRAIWRRWLGIKIAQSIMTDGNVNNSEKPTSSTAQRATSYRGKKERVKSKTSGEIE